MTFIRYKMRHRLQDKYGMTYKQFSAYLQAQTDIQCEKLEELARYVELKI